MEREGLLHLVRVRARVRVRVRVRARVRARGRVRGRGGGGLLHLDVERGLLLGHLLLVAHLLRLRLRLRVICSAGLG